MTETLILLATFLGVLLLSTVILGRIVSRREMASRLAEAATEAGAGDNLLYDQVAGGLGDEYGIYIKHYFDVVRNDTNQDSLPNRLIRAGFFSPNANAVFQVMRAAVSLLSFLAVYLVFDLYLVSVSRSVAILISMMCAGFVFFLGSIVVERMGVAKEKAYRRLFPDFMDMLIICVDAGLSIEAAADRVAREFMATRPDFGLHLSIMMLEVTGRQAPARCTREFGHSATHR